MENQNENIAETVLRVSSKPFEIGNQVALPYGWKLEDAESTLTTSIREATGFKMYHGKPGV